MTVSTGAADSGTLTVSSGTTLTDAGTLTVNSGGTVNDSGTLTVEHRHLDRQRHPDRRLRRHPGRTAAPSAVR